MLRHLTTSLILVLVATGCRVAPKAAASDNHETLMLEMQSLLEEQEQLQLRMEETKSSADMSWDLQRELDDMLVRDAEINNRLSVIKTTLNKSHLYR